MHDTLSFGTTRETASERESFQTRPFPSEPTRTTAIFVSPVPRKPNGNSPSIDF